MCWFSFLVKRSHPLYSLANIVLFLVACTDFVLLRLYLGAFEAPTSQMLYSTMTLYDNIIMLLSPCHETPVKYVI